MHDAGDAPRPGTLAGRLQAARTRAFVGREEEIAVFRGALRTPEPPFAVLHLHGPGGVGKSALLQRLADEARVAGRVTIVVDGRAISPSPDGVLDAIAAQIGADDALDALQQAGAPVLCLDTYESLRALDAWVRERLVPALPAASIVVIAGREPPSADWVEDPGWRPLLRSRAVGDLPATQARELLASRSVPSDLAERALAFAGGHPLALVLVAELAAQEDAADLDPRGDPDVVAALVERFVEHVPSPAHRDALAILAAARVTNEDLLRQTVDDTPAEALFGWLERLSFVSRSAEGLVAHDLARDALDADRRWRDPEGHAALDRRLARAIGRRPNLASGRGRDRAMLDVIYLHRRHPAMGRFFSSDMQGWAGPADRDDGPAIREILERNESPEAAGLVTAWLEHAPESIRAFREGSGELIGFAANLVLDALADPPVADPGVAAIRAWAARNGPLEPGHRLSIARSWSGREGQTTEIHDYVAASSGLIWVTEPDLACSFVVVNDIAMWQPMFAWFDFHHIPEAAFEVGGRRYDVVAHDWRTSPRGQWATMVARRAADRSAVPEPFVRSGPGEGRPLPNRERFGAMVREALRGYRRPDELAGGELARMRLAAAHEDPAVAVRTAIDEAVAELGDHPRDEKLRRALDATYLRPAPTQEAAAELLGLPLSTYRRHLSAGVRRITDILWARELSA